MIGALDPAVLPPDLAAIIAGYSPVPVTIGCSGHTVLRLHAGGRESFYLKSGPHSGHAPLLQEKLRLDWLRGKMPVPEVRFHATTPGYEYLLTTALPGLHAADQTHASDLPRLIDLLAEGLHRFHSLPVPSCPFDFRLPLLLADIRRRMDQGVIDESRLEDECQGRTIESILREIEGIGITGEDLVVSHGDYSLPNIIIADNTISGFIDLGSADVWDRYHDLMCAAWSIAHNFGEHHVARFFAAYGIPSADRERLRLRRLLLHLL